MQYILNLIATLSSVCNHTMKRVKILLLFVDLLHCSNGQPHLGLLHWIKVCLAVSGAQLPPVLVTIINMPAQDSTIHARIDLCLYGYDLHVAYLEVEGAGHQVEGVGLVDHQELEVEEGEEELEVHPPASEAEEEGEGEQGLKGPGELTPVH